MSQEIKIVLKSGKDQSVKRYHPWIFSGAIKKIYGSPVNGDMVEVYSNKDEFLAKGHFQDGSIAVRILSFTNQVIGSDFFASKIRDAYIYREQIGLVNNSVTTMYRLVHAEGDGLPGLIIDIYNDIAVLQMHSIGMFQQLDIISEIIQDIYGNRIKTILNKSKHTLPEKAFIDSESDLLAFGEKCLETIAMENNLKINVNLEKGQKTGFFIDQRDNRHLLGQYTAGKKVLNMFSYTGGFSLYALQGNAVEVHSVDSSAHATEITEKNVALNAFNVKKHQAITADAFEYLKQMDNNYDIIILDPPAFAKHQNTIHNALQGYKRLNQVAIEKVKSGGMIFTFSCSQVVSKENFRKSVFAAAANSGRKVRIMYQLTQPLDHPVNIYHPESEYLKGLVLYVK